MKLHIGQLQDPAKNAFSSRTAEGRRIEAGTAWKIPPWHLPPDVMPKIDQDIARKKRRREAPKDERPRPTLEIPGDSPFDRPPPDEHPPEPGTESTIVDYSV